MKTFFFALLSSTLSASAFLAPGERFPDLDFPPIAGGEPVAFSTLTGEKLMLHLFASW